MKREHCFRYLTALTADRVETIDRLEPPTKDAAVIELIVRRFVGLFATGKTTDSIYERLSCPLEPRKLEGFKTWLREEHARTNDSHYRWAGHHLDVAQKPIEHKVVKPEPAIPRPSATEALACIAALGRLERSGLDAGESATFKRTMSDVIDAWDEEVSGATEDGACPDCGTGYLLELDASSHVVSCREHRGMARLEAAKEAARIVGVTLSSSATKVDLPPEARAEYGQSWEAHQALDFVLQSAASRKALPRVQNPARLLLRVAREWAHYVDRSTDPCPWCSEVLALPKMLAHLRACEQHPAACAAREVASDRRLPVGLVSLVLERMTSRHKLALLIRACDVFDGEMGWTGDAGYSDEYSERPWRAAVARAGRFLAIPERGALPPRSGHSAPREAMTRLLAERAGTAADIATLRAAAQELDGWIASVGFATTCPACGWKGVPRAALPRHLESCLLHPPVRRARSLAAIRQLEGSAAPGAPRLDEYAGPDFRDRIRDYVRQKRDTALATLFAFEATELSKDDRDDLARFVDDWEELYSVVLAPKCPWCGAADLSGAHLLACPKHPAMGVESHAQGLARTAVRLRLEADHCVVALARLHLACGEFWNGMRDGEDGKSISNPEIEAAWKQARNEASATLATISERPSDSE